MRHARTHVLGRWAFTACLGLVVLSAGCTHNYYYTSANPCGPTPTMVVPGPVAAGSVCDVPAGGTVVAGGSVTEGPQIVSRARPPRVVTSEPGARSSGRFSWRAADPDGGMITTKVEGAADAATITR